jgi:hypothetical protein
MRHDEIESCFFLLSFSLLLLGIRNEKWRAGQQLFPNTKLLNDNSEKRGEGVRP